MTKIIVGTLVATILYFGFQSAMWMGGMHDDFASYTPKQDTLLTEIGKNVDAEGVYFLPGRDPNVKLTHEQEEAKMKEGVGKPWAMVFYHKAMKGMESTNILKGLLYALLSALLVTLVLSNGTYASFGGRFAVAFSFALFALLTSIMNDLNWWDFPWNFMKAKIIDVVGGWALASIWLGWYMKKPVQG